MTYTATTATKKLAKLKKRIRLAAGGSSASKTISILLLLIDDAQTDKEPTLTSVVSETFPHLRRGAMRDFLDIMKIHGYYDENSWSRTDYIYTLPNSSQIEFFSAEDADKVRGPRRDRLFVNELDNIKWETWRQLLLRTRQYAWADWNPVSDFYVYEKYQIEDDPISVGDERVDFTILTYKDNDALEPGVVEEIEQLKSDKNAWKVYGEGKRGETKGRIYKGWRIIDEMPHEARLEARGLDFGYSNHETAIVDVYYYNGGYVLDERMYKRGMTNKNIADFLITLNNSEYSQVIADSAEPKSIDEIDSYGVTILPASKGKGSVNQGISLVQSKPISVTKRSTNLIKEYRNYMWKVDRDGESLNQPRKFLDHALDAVRYAIGEVAQNPITDAKPYVPPAVQSLRARHNTGMPTTRPDFLR